MKKAIIIQDTTNIVPTQLDIISLCKGLKSPINNLEVSKNKVYFANQRSLVESNLKNDLTLVSVIPVFATIINGVVSNYTVKNNKYPDTGIVGFVVFTKKSLKQALEYKRIRSNFSPQRTKEVAEFIEEELADINLFNSGNVYHILLEEDSKVIEEFISVTGKTPEDALNKVFEVLKTEGEDPDSFEISIEV